MAADAVIERDNRGFRPQRGFTMVEVMVAILLTGLTVIGVIGLFRVETRASTSSRRTTEAAVLAQDKLEELRTIAVASHTDSDTPLDPLTGSASIFTRNWVVAPDPEDASIVSITVTVSWNEGGVPRTVQVSGQRGGS